MKNTDDIFFFTEPLYKAAIKESDRMLHKNVIIGIPHIKYTVDVISGKKKYAAVNCHFWQFRSSKNTFIKRCIVNAVKQLIII